jgi:hypothetical protein
MNNTGNKVSRKCSSCNGSGNYWASAQDCRSCYSCGGIGKIRKTVDQWDKHDAKRAAMRISYTEFCAEETRNAIAAEDAKMMVLLEIDSKGLDGARSFFAAKKANNNAMTGLLLALDSVMDEAHENGQDGKAKLFCDARNKLVGWINKR